MENKKCKNCSNEFEPKNNIRGHEQLYCSMKCRNQAAVKRRESRLMSNSNLISNEEKQDEQTTERIYTSSEDRGNQQNFYGGHPRENTRASFGGGVITDTHLATIKELYEAKNQTIFYQLKCEALERENASLKMEIANLEDEIDQEEESSGYSGMLGGVMEQFKQDPVNTVNFATEIIGNLFKPKK